MPRKEPENKDSKEWREWKARQTFAALTATGIYSPRITVEDLTVLMHHINDLVKQKRGG
jgi:hypothetical protein